MADQEQFSWKCPKCSVINNGFYLKCDCGYIVEADEQIKYKVDEPKTKPEKTAKGPILSLEQLEIHDPKSAERKWKCPRCSKTNSNFYLKCDCGYIVGEPFDLIQQGTIQSSKFRTRDEYDAWKAQKIKESEEKRQVSVSEEFDIRSYYQVLELKANASKGEIKQAYKDLLNVWNPARFNEDLNLKQKAEEKTNALDNAYERLLLYLAKDNKQASQKETLDRKSQTSTDTSASGTDYSEVNQEGSVFMSGGGSHARNQWGSSQSTIMVAYAGFWKRVVACMIDAIVWVFIGLIFTFVYVSMSGKPSNLPASVTLIEWAMASTVGTLFSLIVPWLYYSMMESSAKQATLGKMAVGIVVTDLEGNRISFGKATGRYFAKILSALILLIGYFMAGFTQKKQALHDMIAGTLVILKC